MQISAKLLLIESRDAARELLTDHFRALGYEVIEAHSLAEAAMCMHPHVELAVVSLQTPPSPAELAGALRGAKRVVFLGPRELVDRLSGSASAFSEPLDMEELCRYCRPSGAA